MSVMLGLIFISVCVILSCDALVAPKVAFVTGANGFVGREVVREILKHNCNVDDEIVCLVREGRVEEESQYWKSVAAECITVLPYDMLDGGTSLNQALQDVYSPHKECILYHLASVFGPTEDHRQTALNNVKGTEDVVRCLVKFPNTKLVLTSSMAAVRGTGQVPKNGQCYSYEDWNNVSELGKNWGNSYQWSKAESERRAWELAKVHNIPMVALCPSFIFGPSTDGTFESSSFSIQLVRQWIHGESEVQSRLCVDVRDVAKVHVAAAGSQVGVGKRYLVSTERRLPSKILAEAIREVSPNPDKITYDADFDGGAIPIGDQEVIAEERLNKDLGITLTPSDVTFQDMARAMLA